MTRPCSTVPEPGGKPRPSGKGETNWRNSSSLGALPKANVELPPCADAQPHAKITHTAIARAVARGCASVVMRIGHPPVRRDVPALDRVQVVDGPGWSVQTTH